MKTWVTTGVVSVFRKFVSTITHGALLALDVCMAMSLTLLLMNRLPRVERPKSLVLVGASRLGKTQWARSLGDHAYIANIWDLSAFDSIPDTFWNAGYVVFDDINWESIKHSAKSWFGAQRDFSVSDKYRKKKRIVGGVPTIFLCNPDAYSGELSNFVEGEWGRENITVIMLECRLYSPPRLTLTASLGGGANPTPGQLSLFGGYRP